MSVYNTEEGYLRGAIESILRQTYDTFEFIIVLDCPTDGSVEIIREYAEADQRIEVIANPVNLGLTKSLNVALERARGKYIARMDADDYSLPYRFEKQVAYLEGNPDTAVVGGYVYTGIARSRFMTAWNRNRDVAQIHMLFHNAGVAHPTAMFRRVLPDGTEPRYDERIRKSQDYALWAELIEKAKIVVLDDILLVYRVHPKQISANSTDQLRYAGMVVADLFEKRFGLKRPEEIEALINIYAGSDKKPCIEDVERIFKKLCGINAELGMYPKRVFRAVLTEIEMEYFYLNRSNVRIFPPGWVRKNCRIFTPANIMRFIWIYLWPKFRYDQRFAQFRKDKQVFLLKDVQLSFDQKVELNINGRE